VGEALKRGNHEKRFGGSEHKPKGGRKVEKRVGKNIRYGNVTIREGHLGFEKSQSQQKKNGRGGPTSAG